MPTSSDPGLPGQPHPLPADAVPPTSARTELRRFPHGAVLAFVRRGRARLRRSLRRRAERARACGEHRALRAVATGLAVGGFLLLALAPPAFAASKAPASLTGVISNLQTWLVGILVGVATLFLTIGGLRYVTAGGDPMQVERAKTALKSAAIGYALAALAPLIVSILTSVVG